MPERTSPFSFRLLGAPADVVGGNGAAQRPRDLLDFALARFFELFFGQRRVGGAEVDRARGDLLDPAAAADRSVGDGDFRFARRSRTAISTSAGATRVLPAPTSGEVAPPPSRSSSLDELPQAATAEA